LAKAAAEEKVRKPPLLLHVEHLSNFPRNSASKPCL
jgi:hypothetical protein